MSRPLAEILICNNILFYITVCPRKAFHVCKSISISLFLMENKYCCWIPYSTGEGSLP